MMVRLREIPRTAAFAWSPDANAPWVATGTKSGAVDVDFSNETCLELWDLALDDSKQGQELKATVTLPTETGFHDLAWSAAEDRERGIIAGGLDNGALGLWDAAQLVEDPSSALLSTNKIHSGAIKALQFNPKLPNFVATGGAKGELYISDLNHLDSPVRLGSTAARADDIDCLDWNKRVGNILVTGSSGGFVTVWDMKTKKESLTLNNYGRKAASAIAWDPTKPTRLITAVPLEQEPAILVWDLRNSNAPEKIMKGHDSGVLSLSWCTQDPDLLLSCGKDNRTIMWNPQTGEAYGDYPVVTNWTFQTRWNPNNPNMFATASFDGKVQIQTIQNTNPSQTESNEQTTAADGEEFFSKASTQPQSSSFSLQKAPKWLERPVSVSFGFGGRLISVKQVDPAKSRASAITIGKFEIDSSVGKTTESFEKAIGSGSLVDLCQERATAAKSEDEKADWKVIETLVSSNPRSQLVRYLGFEHSASDAADKLQKLGVNHADEQQAPPKPAVNGMEKSHKRFQSIFASSADGDFLSELAATKGTKTNNPFEIYTGSESEADKKITSAITLGHFDQALDVCLSEDRMSDAFMVAICGGEQCIKKAQEAYFAKQDKGPNYLRLLASVVGKNLWDTVHNADLANWKEVMATLCTFADEKEFPDLCEALGDRLDEQTPASSSARRDASFCYLAGSKLEKVINIWIQELEEHEDSGETDRDASSAYSIHARGLQDLIEKVTIFRSVVNFKDPELSKSGDWRLEALYSKYLEYADVVAGHGQLAVAQKYLDLLPPSYPGSDVAKTRIEQATRKKPVAQAAAATVQPQSTTAKSRQPARPGYAAPQDMFTPSPAVAASSYAPHGQQPTPSFAPPSQMSNPYAPQVAAAQHNPYAPPQQMQASHLNQQGYGMHLPNSIPPPPRAFNQSPSVPPPSQAKDMKAWNDIPDNFSSQPRSRRGTPAPAQPPVHNPFGQSSPGQNMPPAAAPPMGQRQTRTPLPPPPKVGAGPPRVTSPLSSQMGYTPLDRPPSSSSNAYAPPASAVTSPPPMGPGMMAPPVARGPSPFTAPPSGAPPPNRYAPAAGSQASQQPAPSRPNIAPPPQGSSFQSSVTPMNPYAPSQPQQQQSSSQYGPSQTPQQPRAAALPPPPQAQFTSGPSQGGPTPAQAARPSTANSETRSTQAARKYPKGDRTHIPPNAQPIVQILSQEMSRVKARAPASFKPQVVDTEKRLEILFDHLNNEDLIKPSTVEQLVELSRALEARDFNKASEIQMDVHTNKVEECGNWMVGVKRLVGMCRATP